MLQFLRVWLRRLNRNPFRTFLNISSLTLGFFVVLISGLIIHHELSYESMHHRSGCIFRVTMHNHADQYDMHWARMDRDYVNRLEDELPGIEALIRFQDYQPRDIRIGEEAFRLEHAYSTDHEVFRVFDFPFIAGDPETALVKPQSVVLTRKTAMTLFGSTRVLGEGIQILEDDEPVWYEVTGVMEDIPENTHLPVNLLTSFPSEEARSGWAYTYLLLESPEYAKEVEDHLPDLVVKYGNGEIPEQISFPLQPLSSIHLTSRLAREITLNSSMEYVWVFLIAGILILFLALANYINLLVAEIMQRRKSLAIHKVLGTGNVYLGQRLVAEILCMTGLSAVLACGIFYTFRPYLDEFLPLITPGLFHIVWMAVIVVLSTLVAAAFPVRYLTTTRTSVAVGNNAGSQTGNGTGYIRNAIAGLQLVLSITIVSAVLILESQFRFMLAENRSAHGDQVLAIREIPKNLQTRQDALKDELLKGPGVMSVSRVMEIPSREIRDAGPVTLEGAELPIDERPVMDIQVADAEYFRTNGYEMLAGRTFTESPEAPQGDDLLFHLTSAPREYVINESAMAMLGFKVPEEVIDRRISWEIGGIKLQSGPVIGVVKDHYQESLRNRIDPVVIIQEPVWTRNLLVRIKPQFTAEALQHAKVVWSKLAPDYPLQMEFVDELYARQYAHEQNQLDILRVLSLLVVIISFAGLLALFYYLISVKEKELAIRKVLGAGTRSLAVLIGRPLILMMFAGLVIAVPMTIFLIRLWLDQFAYRVNISLYYFLTATIVILAVLFLSSIRLLSRLERENVGKLLKAE